MALRARKVSGAFEKRAPGLYTQPGVTTYERLEGKKVKRQNKSTQLEFPNF